MTEQKSVARKAYEKLQALGANRRAMALLVSGLGSFLVFLLIVLFTRKPTINLPSEAFAEASMRWKDLTHLIVLPGHAIQWCTESDKSVADESCWHLQSFQHGQVPLFLAHIRKAIEEASNDPKSLLVFSGGQTRPGVGLRTEAYSYFSAAEQLGYFNKYGNNVFDRSVSEDFARDSLENLMFSICRFKEITGRYPRKISVVGFPFKGPRFVELHRKAVNFPMENFRYIGVEVKGHDQSKIVDGAYADFKADLYGCGKRLFEKRVSRNPYKHLHGYKATCPDMIHYFDACSSHQACAESFYRAQVIENLTTQKPLELTRDEKQRITEMFKRMSQFDVEWPSELDQRDDEPLLKLSQMDLDGLSVEEIEQLLGPELLDRFHASLTDPSFLHQVADESSGWKPWWSPSLIQQVDRPTPNAPGTIANLPPLQKISKLPPSEFLWNNLMELLFLYVYLGNLYLGEVGEEFVNSFSASSKVFSAPDFKYESAMAALNAAINTVKNDPVLCNPTTFTVKVCKDLVDLVRVPENALRALCELYSAMSRLSSSSKALFLASKKMYFYAVWLNSELAQNHDLVEDILRALIMIIGGVHDRLGSDGDSGRPDKSKMQQIKMP